MANLISLISFLFLLPFVTRGCLGVPVCSPIPGADDRDLIQVALNLEFLEAEFFLYGSLGFGLDNIAPSLAAGGPPPIGARRADLLPLVRSIIEEFAYEEVGHLRAIITRIGGFPRPLIDLSPQNFANIMNDAVGYKLEPPFDPYANSINYLLASYVIPYVGLVGYVGAIPELDNLASKKLVASLLGVEAGQDAVIRGMLYARADLQVVPYNKTVAEFTRAISELRNRLGSCGDKDEGIIVPPVLGAEKRTSTNVLSADIDSLSYSRTPQEIFRTVYGTGNERKPGGFFPRGANGKIARSFLKI